MNNYDKTIDELVNRSMDKHSMPLREFIESEGLQTYTPGFVDIIFVEDLCSFTVPCKEFMILARERYDEKTNLPVAEYAVYSQHDNSGLEPLVNSMNSNAEYRLEYVGEETFENVAFAIAYAADLITKTSNFNYDDPVDMLMNMTNPGENWTIEDAGHILSEAEAHGWHFAPDIDAQYILDLYNDMEPEEE